MSNSPNSQDGHRQFSVHCFNAAWQLIDKPQRSPDEEELMLHLSHASLWHWKQRSDCTNANLSIGYWQLSRVYALVGDSERAASYGNRCLEHTPADEPYLLGYAHEALARAAAVTGDQALTNAHQAEARRHAENIASDEDKQLLLADLHALEKLPGS